MPPAAHAHWATPQKFFDKLNREFQFDIDLCATPESAKCDLYFTEDQNALAQMWRGVCFMNPPYGRGIERWVRKAYYAARNGATIVCLLPARTDTAWWHDYCSKGEVRFVRGRLKFGGSRTNAPFPSVVVIFRPAEAEEQTEEMSGGE